MKFLIVLTISFLLVYLVKGDTYNKQINRLLLDDDECYALGTNILVDYLENNKDYQRFVSPMMIVFTATYNVLHNIKNKQGMNTNQNENQMENILLSIVEVNQVSAYLREFTKGSFKVLSRVASSLEDHLQNLIFSITNSLQDNVSLAIVRSKKSIVESLSALFVAQKLGDRSIEKITTLYSKLYEKYYTFINDKVTRFMKLKDQVQKLPNESVHNAIESLVIEAEADIDHVNGFHEYMERIYDSIDLEMTEEEKNQGLDKYIHN